MMNIERTILYLPKNNAANKNITGIIVEMLEVEVSSC